MTETTTPAVPDKPTTTVTRPQPADLFVHQLNNMRGEIEKALPRHMSGERFVRIVVTEVRKTPKLAMCTPVSVFGALLTASALGLEPGLNGECYLVPYEDRKHGRTECQLILGYQGVAKLFWQAPQAAFLDTGYVCERDHWVYQKGLDPVLEHTPATGDRGKIIAYYAVAGLSTGARQFEAFTPDQIKRLRGGKVGSSGDIPDPEHWMERKTALKQVLKLMPKSTELYAAMSADEQIHTVADAQQIVSGVDLATGEITEEQA